MHYYLNCQEHYLEEVSLDDYSYEVGSDIPFKGVMYRIMEIKIIEPNEGKIVLECKRKVTRRRLAISIPRERI